MAALVMAFVAGMAVGNGPERVSTEAEQGLCLKGWWEATWQYISDDGEVSTMQGMFKDGHHVGPDGQIDIPYTWKDEGNGRCRLNESEGNNTEFHLGIYKQESHSLTICLNYGGNGRPAAFWVEGKRGLLILHRVKPPK